MVAILLDMPRCGDWSRSFYFNCYVVFDKGDHQGSHLKQLLTEDEWRRSRDQIYAKISEIENGESRWSHRRQASKACFEDSILAGNRRAKLREYIAGRQRPKKRAKLNQSGLRVIDKLIATDCSPEWMVLDAIPVIPPDLGNGAA